MKKIKIGITTISLVALISLIFTAVVSANSSPNTKAFVDNKPEYVQDEIIVKFKGDTESFRVIKTPQGKVMEKVKEYKGKANVVYAEPNYILSAFSPNDTYYPNLWALDNQGQEIYNKAGDSLGSGTVDADVDWEEAWGISLDNNVVVAVLDTGIDETHPDLINKIVAGYDFVNNDDDPHDLYGHGTHVAGTVAAETNNAQGVAGVAFSNVKIMPVQVLNDSGSGTTSGIANGIRYAADKGVKVINLSLGGRSSQTLKDAVDYAWENGVVLVAAAGNDGGGKKYYPASYSNVISVAATDYNDNTASFSNFNDQVEVSAPGVNVFSTFPTYSFKIQELYGRSLDYDVGSGTSMSVPHVVGLAGLLFAQDLSKTNQEVRDIIRNSADDLGASGWDRHFGWGRMNVYQALAYGLPVDNDGDGYFSDIDCNDNNPAIYPGATEVCNGVDDDCDELIDEGFDIDEDGYTTCGGDCDDNNSAINPGATELCDDLIDNDCDGLIDSADPDCIVTSCSNCFKGICDGKCNPSKEDASCPDCS